jgi:phospholipase C
MRFSSPLTSLAFVPLALLAAISAHHAALGASRQQAETTTPIKHLVVIFEENKSFDAYFGTYPVAANPPGEPAFVAAAGSPAVNGFTEALLHNNPNLANPIRIDRADAFTCFVNNGYEEEQKAANGGLLDRYVQFTSLPRKNATEFCPTDSAGDIDTSMGYYDGNTVTALWSYAQRFAISDNSFGSTFGQSTIGALNLVAGDASGVLCGPRKSVFGDVPVCGSGRDPLPSSSSVAAPSNGSTATLYADVHPYWDVCAEDGRASKVTALSKRNLGDMLNAAGVSWGWFQGGFAKAPDGGCNRDMHVRGAFDRQFGIDPTTDPNPVPDYIPHHEPFQYFASTANPGHLPPSSVANVGLSDQANHQYDLTTFWQAAGAGNLPAVSFLKAPHYQDVHPGDSNPIDEQVFLTQTINRLQNLPEWSSMAIVVAWDDSGGFYDHVTGPVLSHSNTALDTGCSTVTDGPPARCGYGPRLPLLVISPFAKRNYVSHALTDQTSITRLIEDNWLGRQRISDVSFDSLAGTMLDLMDRNHPDGRILLLDSDTGLPMGS